MKRLFLSILCVFTVSVFLCPSGRAEIVTYVDENDNVHYVNTEFSSVPEKYRDQIKKRTTPARYDPDQNKRFDSLPAGETAKFMEKLNTLLEKDEKGGIAEVPSSPSEYTPNTPIEVYSKESCAACVFWEVFLNSKNLTYLKYDVENDPDAKRRLESFKTKLLPVTVIGDNIIEGLDQTKLLSIVKPKRPPVANPFETSSGKK